MSEMLDNALVSCLLRAIPVSLRGAIRLEGMTTLEKAARIREYALELVANHDEGLSWKNEAQVDNWYNQRMEQYLERTMHEKTLGKHRSGA